MDLNSPLAIVTLLIVGLLSGFVNTIASSGSAVTLPVLIYMGLPATVANGTNRLPIIVSAVAALAAMSRNSAVDWRRGFLLSGPMAAGSLLGVWVATRMDARSMGMAVSTTVPPPPPPGLSRWSDDCQLKHRRTTSATTGLAPVER